MYKKLFSDSIIYGLGGVLIKSFAFFTLPIYTRIFSPVQYGVIEMFATLAGIFSMFMTLGLDSAQSYYYMQAKNDGSIDEKNIIGEIFQLRVIFGLAVVFIAVAGSSMIIRVVFQTPVPSAYLWLVVVATLFSTLISQSLEIFRLIYKPWQYISLSFVQTILGIGFVLLFAYRLNRGLSGYFTGMLIGSMISLIIGWVATRKYRYWGKIHTERWKEYLRFGIPLLPAGLMVWIMSASDRWFIMNMMGSYDTGIYAIGAKISMLIMLAVEPFRKAWWPIAMDMLNKEDGPDFFKRVALVYVGLGSLAAVTLTLSAPYIIRYFADERYFESWRMVGILCWGSIFYGFYLISMLGVFKVKKTYLNIYIHGSGAAINLILNYYLVPIYGIVGAAAATSISILVANIVGMIISNRHYRIDWNWGTMAGILIVSWSFILWYTVLL